MAGLVTWMDAQRSLQSIICHVSRRLDDPKMTIRVSTVGTRFLLEIEECQWVEEGYMNRLVPIFGGRRYTLDIDAEDMDKVDAILVINREYERVILGKK